MEADVKDLATLLKLQHIDMEALRTKKKFDGLPQRTRILESRSKRQEIEAKRDKVSALRKDADGAASRIRDEDARLVAKQVDTQAKIDASKGDYRSVEALSKELNGIAKRRNTLEVELQEAQAKIDQIKGVEQQIEGALAAVASQEETFVSSFQEEGGALNSAIVGLERERESLAASLPPALLEEYERIAKRSSGIAVARLVGSSCSVCRASIDDGRLLQLKAEAPLATCPSCKRLLVVER